MSYMADRFYDLILDLKRRISTNQDKPFGSTAFELAFEKCIRDGHSVSEEEILKRLQGLTPPDGLKAPYFFLQAVLLYRQEKWIDALGPCIYASQQDIHINSLTLIGDLFFQLQDYKQASDYFHRALQIEPETLHLISYLALSLFGSGQPNAAYPHFEKSHQLEPNNELITYQYARACILLGHLDKAQMLFLNNVQKKAPHLPSLSGLACAHLFCAEATSTKTIEKLAQHCSKSYPEQHIAKTGQKHKRIKIGYLSADFRKHSCAFFLEPIIANHTKKYEVHLFSYTRKNDGITQHFANLDVKFHDMINIPAEEHYQYLRGQKLDIAVDTMGHTGRIPIEFYFRRIAPVQLNYLGFASSTYIPTMDFRFVDAYTDPVESNNYHSETLKRLSQCFLTYKPILGAPPMRPSPYQRNGHITFGSFNNFSKINDDVFKVWAQLLLKVPTAKLLLKSWNNNDVERNEHLQQLALSLGIDPQRLVFLPRARDYDEHLSLYNEVDIALDTFPYNGTTTTFEALLMGTPVVSLEGNSHRSRVGLSILANMDLSYLCGKSVNGYIETAQYLANNVDLLDQLNGNLRQKLLSSHLCDAQGFIENFEEALETIIDV